jgi:hypothetical protein
MKSKNRRHSNTTCTIYHHELTTDYQNNITYFLITELEDGVPNRTYYYLIPSSFKDGSLQGEIHERFAPYSPN